VTFSGWQEGNRGEELSDLMDRALAALEDGFS
jgi:hypothetical protein